MSANLTVLTMTQRNIIETSLLWHQGSCQKPTGWWWRWLSAAPGLRHHRWPCSTSSPPPCCWRRGCRWTQKWSWTPVWQQLIYDLEPLCNSSSNRILNPCVTARRGHVQTDWVVAELKYDLEPLCDSNSNMILNPCATATQIWSWTPMWQQLNCDLAFLWNSNSNMILNP